MAPPLRQRPEVPPARGRRLPAPLPGSAPPPDWAAALAVVERFADAEASGQELARERSASSARAEAVRAAGRAGDMDWWTAWQHEGIIRGATQASGFAAAWTCVNKSLAACSNEAGEEMRLAPGRMGDLLYDVCGYLNWEAPSPRAGAARRAAGGFRHLPGEGVRRPARPR